MPKALKSDARNIILQVKQFFEQEARQGAPIIPYNQIQTRVAAATGISQNLVSKIIKEGKRANESGVKITTPGKTRRRTSGFIHVDDFDMGVIRRKIHEFYSVKKELPTIVKILTILREEINFKGNRETLRKILHKLGFRFRKTQSNRKVLMERNEISAWRSKYLHELSENEKSSKPRPVIYLDETYIHSSHTSGKCWQAQGIEGVLEPVSKGQRYIILHAGGETGFVDNACLVFRSNTKSGDYHDEMNNVNFKKWTLEKLIPNLKEPSLIIMDNAPYHSVCLNRSPNTNTLKKDMQEWLSQNSIDYSEDMTKPQLLEIIKRNKPDPIYDINNTLAEHGHKCVRLPPYHCDLNPIELIWSTMKRKVADVNIDHHTKEIPRLINEAFQSITPEEWKKHCKHVHKLENEYRLKDAYLDKPFIVNLESDSDTESDSENDDDFSDPNNGLSIPGIWPMDRDTCASTSTFKVDHTYCKPGFL